MSTREDRLAQRPGTRLTPVTPPPSQRERRLLFDVRCHQKGRTCAFHSRRVKANTHREALDQVVLAKRFGPLHRVHKHLPQFVANPKPETMKQVEGLPPNKGHMDVRHGAIYVQKVGE